MTLELFGGCIYWPAARVTIWYLSDYWDFDWYRTVETWMDNLIPWLGFRYVFFVDGDEMRWDEIRWDESPCDWKALRVPLERLCTREKEDNDRSVDLLKVHRWRWLSLIAVNVPSFPSTPLLGLGREGGGGGSGGGEELSGACLSR